MPNWLHSVPVSDRLVDPSALLPLISISRIEVIVPSDEAVLIPIRGAGSRAELCDTPATERVFLLKDQHLDSTRPLRRT
jgi:hypothetical protein